MYALAPEGYSDTATPSAVEELLNRPIDTPRVPSTATAQTSHSRVKGGDEMRATGGNTVTTQASVSAVDPSNRLRSRPDVSTLTSINGEGIGTDGVEVAVVVGEALAVTVSVVVTERLPLEETEGTRVKLGELDTAVVAVVDGGSVIDWEAVLEVHECDDEVD